MRRPIRPSTSVASACGSRRRLEPLRRRARVVTGVNSFGFGGTNACALLAAAPSPQAASAAAAPAEQAMPPLLLSARSATGLKALARDWQARLGQAGALPLPALLRGAARHRDLLPHRLALRGADAASLAAGLAAWRAGEAGAAASGLAGRSDRIAFVFSGNGAPWPGMAQAAFAASAPFRAAVAEADAALAPWLGWSVAEQIAAGVSAEAVEATDRAQPLLFAVQHGIVAALAAQGIRPALCLGHSVGEIAAATAAGLLPLDAAARLIVSRSRHQADHPRHRPHGRARRPGRARPAGARRMRPGARDRRDQRARRDHRGRTGRCAASPRPGRCRPALELDRPRPRLCLPQRRHGPAAGCPAGRSRQAWPPPSPGIPMVSTVTGEALTAAGCPAAYWWRNLREPVAFLPALARR